MSHKEKWCLVGKRGALKHKKIKLFGPHIIIGRTEENDIVIPEHAVSRNHAKIEFKDNYLWITDLKSKNGTYVNQQKISTHKICDQDTFQIGDAKALFKLESSELNPQQHHPMMASILFWLQDKRHRLIFAGLCFTLPLLIQILFIQPTGSKSMKNNDPTLESVSEEAAGQPHFDDHFTPLASSLPQTSNLFDNINLEELQQNLTSALSVEDYPAAYALLKQITQVDPSPSFIDQLALVEKNLKNKIAGYEENALREYEKLNYDKAITEWQKALSLAQNYDPNLKQKIEAQIKEAQEKFAGK